MARFFINFRQSKKLNKAITTLPAIAVRSVATGLFMMAFFTGLWTGIAWGGLIGSAGQWVLGLFVLCVIFFVVQAIGFLKAAKSYPSIQTPEEVKQGKKMGMWFGIIFGAEGLFIVLAINLVNNMGHPDLIIPSIALVVGLHFYPMAWIFKRKIDYWLATWATGIAICGIIFTLHKSFLYTTILAFVGIGLAMATTGYGLYMVYYGRKMIRENPIA
jgi:hypothetical protein